MKKKRNNTTNSWRKIGLIKSKKYVIYAKKDLVLMMIIKYHKVRDHCHCTGKFREAAHSICNMSNVNPCSISEWFYIWLSFYNQRASKKNWGSIWMPRRKCREIY